MRKLTTQFYFIFAIGFILSWLGLHSFWIKKIEDLFYQIENKEIIKSSSQILYLTELEAKQVSLKTNDWASWDHSYQFILGQRPQYIKENFSDPVSTLKLIQINFMIYLDEEKKYKLSYFIDDAYTKVLNVDQADIDTLLSKIDFSLSKSTDFIDLNYKKYFLTINKISTTDGGLKSGYLISGKILNNEFIQKLESITNLKIQFAENLIAQPPLF